jgi:hypothetical protein
MGEVWKARDTRLDRHVASSGLSPRTRRGSRKRRAPGNLRCAPAHRPVRLPKKSAFIRSTAPLRSRPAAAVLRADATLYAGIRLRHQNRPLLLTLPAVPPQRNDPAEHDRFDDHVAGGAAVLARFGDGQPQRTVSAHSGIRSGMPVVRHGSYQSQTSYAATPARTYLAGARTKVLSSPNSCALKRRRTLPTFASSRDG